MVPTHTKGRGHRPDHCRHSQQMESTADTPTHNRSANGAAVGTREKGRFLITLDHAGKAVDSFTKTILGVDHLISAMRTLHAQTHVVSTAEVAAASNT